MRMNADEWGLLEGIEINVIMGYNMQVETVQEN